MKAAWTLAFLRVAPFDTEERQYQDHTVTLYDDGMYHIATIANPYRRHRGSRRGAWKAAKAEIKNELNRLQSVNNKE